MFGQKRKEDTVPNCGFERGGSHHEQSAEAIIPFIEHVLMDDLDTLLATKTNAKVRGGRTCCSSG
jgi:hypothetical protein